MKTKLNNCPFCGSDQVTFESLGQGAETGDPDDFYTLCGSCKASGPIKLTKKRAAKFWNKGYLKDTKRLDKLQELSNPHLAWLLRDTASGRGLRLHETTREDGCATIREAIDNYFSDKKAIAMAPNPDHCMLAQLCEEKFCLKGTHCNFKS